MVPDFLKGKYIPKHMQIAYDLLGTKEVQGTINSPIILEWARELGLDDIYTNDSLAWCGLFFCYVMKKAGREVKLNTKDKYDYLRALKYQTMPNVTEVPKGKESFGDILIFQRPEGGHIGLYFSESKNTFSVLGGNQGDKVSIINISKSRLVKCLRPNYTTFKPEKYLLASNGKISTNEA